MPRRKHRTVASQTGSARCLRVQSKREYRSIDPTDAISDGDGFSGRASGALARRPSGLVVGQWVEKDANERNHSPWRP